MEFKQLEAFVAVVDYGSFSEAARRLYLTQPTISAHIRSLEDELHMKLIIRTTKKTTITAKGYQLYDSAVRMLEIRNNLLENFTGAHKHMIDLAASTIPSSYLLPELLAAFGILSSRSVNDLQRTKQILVFPLEEAAHKRSFYIVYSKNRILNPHVKQFVQFVRDYYM